MNAGTDEQPEIAIWLRKPEMVIIYSGIMTSSIEIPTVSLGLSTTSSWKIDGCIAISRYQSLTQSPGGSLFDKPQIAVPR